jgi:5'-nucleotidase/UDP-sugar diphosphatase
MNWLALHYSSTCMTFLGRLMLALFFSGLLAGLVACGSGPSGPDDDDEGPGGQIPGERLLTVLYTTDERGQIEPGPGSEGAAKLMGLWRSAEGLTEGGTFLVLSGGNSWSQRPISTWFKGESVVEVMNRMGYDGMVIGSAEFHFGGAELANRATEASFPLLSSNVRLKANGSAPGFATPYAVQNVNGLQVGLIGLTPTSTPQSNVPANTEDFDFGPYADALNERVPQARAAGADVVIVLAHLCYEEILPLLPVARQLGVSVIAGSFCGQTKSEVTDGVAIVVPGWGFSEYGKVAIRLRDSTKEILGIQPQVLPNSGGVPDPEVEVMVQHWEDLMGGELAAVIGHVTVQLSKTSTALQNFVMDSWLFAYPADIAMLNDGAIRTGLPLGDITKGAIVGMLPFENSLVELELTGAEVVECLQPSFVLAGMTTRDGYFHSDGTPLKMDSVYHVLTTDFLHGQTDLKFGTFDPNPKDTNLLYYQPTLAYIESLETSSENPLDLFLDPNPRR